MKPLLFGCLALSARSLYEENLGRTRDVSARWAITVGTRQEEAAHGVAIDSIGDVVAVGYHGRTTDQWSGFITRRVASDGALLTARLSAHQTNATDDALELATVHPSGSTGSTTLGTRIVPAARYRGLSAAAAGADGGVAIVGDLTGTIGIADVELAMTSGQLDADALVIMLDP